MSVKFQVTRPFLDGAFSIIYIIYRIFQWFSLKKYCWHKQKWNEHFCLCQQYFSTKVTLKTASIGNSIEVEFLISFSWLEWVYKEEIITTKNDFLWVNRVFLSFVLAFLLVPVMFARLISGSGIEPHFWELLPTQEPFWGTLKFTLTSAIN